MGWGDNQLLGIVFEDSGAWRIFGALTLPQNKLPGLQPAAGHWSHLKPMLVDCLGLRFRSDWCWSHSEHLCGDSTLSQFPSNKTWQDQASQNEENGLCQVLFPVILRILLLQWNTMRFGCIAFPSSKSTKTYEAIGGYRNGCPDF